MYNYYYPGVKSIGKLIFVYGSNTMGIHGKGAALTAKQKYGAKQYLGHGFHEQSYGIPTKGPKFVILPLDQIKVNVDLFRVFTLSNPQYKFYVTPIGTGLAGYNHEEIAPFFKGCVNCWFPINWKPYLE